MGNKESHNISLHDPCIESSSKLGQYDLSECFEKINPCEKELIKEIMTNLTTLLLENFRSLTFLFSYLNNPQFIDQISVKELRQSSGLAIWLSELNRKIYMARKDILNYRRTFSHVVKIHKKINKVKKSSDQFLLEDLEYLIKGDPKSISAFFCDINFDKNKWNYKRGLKEVSKILKLKK